MLLDAEMRDGTNEGQECLDYLLRLVAGFWCAGQQWTVARVILEGMEQNGVEARSALEGAGLKLKRPRPGADYEMLIANKSGGLDVLFRDTQWHGGGWSTALRYLEGAVAGAPQRFDGVSLRNTVIPAAYLPRREKPPAADPPDTRPDVDEDAVRQFSEGEY